MIHGDAALALLEDIKSSTLKPHRQIEVKRLEDENAHVVMIMNEIKQRGEVSEEISVNYIMLKYLKERNDRILRSYKFHRSGFIFDSTASGDSITSLLSSEEDEYMDRYSDIMKEYLEPFDILDFTMNTPPIQFFIQILTLEDCGIVMDEENLIELKRDRIYFIKRSVVIHLINNGLVSVIK